MRIDAAGNVSAPRSGGGGRGPASAVGPADITLVTANIGPGTAVTPTFVIGRAGSDIHQVQVAIKGQPTAVASRQGEWFVASWPRGARPITVVGFNAEGQEIAREGW